MSLYTFPNMSGGIDEVIVGTTSTIPIFTPMFLLFVFLVILIGGATRQKARTGSMDVPMWMTMASITTLMVSLIMTLRSGLIQGETVAIVVAVTCISGMWLFFDRNRNEI